jgi:hypothetical protein
MLRTTIVNCPTDKWVNLYLHVSNLQYFHFTPTLRNGNSLRLCVHWDSEKLHLAGNQPSQPAANHPPSIPHIPFIILHSIGVQYASVFGLEIFACMVLVLVGDIGHYLAYPSGIDGEGAIAILPIEIFQTGV